MPHCSLLKAASPEWPVDRHFFFIFFQGTCLWRLCLSLQMAHQHHAGSNASASGLGIVQPSFFLYWFSRCCSPTASSTGLLFPSTMVLFRACMSHCSTTCGLMSSLQAPPLGVGLAFSLQLDGRPWKPLDERGCPSGLHSGTFSSPSHSEWSFDASWAYKKTSPRINFSVILATGTQAVSGRHPKVNFTYASCRIGNISPDAIYHQRGQVSLEQSYGDVQSGDCYLSASPTGHKIYVASDPSLGI
jgi:hypothetical protein